MQHKLLIIIGVTLSFCMASAHADPRLSVDEEARAAVSMWRDSCPRAKAGESCFVLQRVKLIRSCQDSAELATPRQRKRNMARRAQAALLRVVLRYEQGSDNDFKKSEEYAKVLYAIAESKLEDFLRLRSPRGLEFVGAKKKQSEQRFASFTDEAKAAAMRSNDAFSNVATLPESVATQELRQAAMAGAARGFRHFAILFYAMEMPPEITRGPYAEDAKAAFCDALAEAAHPLEEKSLAIASACVKASKSTPASATTRACEAMQGAIGLFEDPRVLQRTLHRTARPARLCYEKTMARSPKLEGTETIEIEVGDGGEVLAAQSAGLGDKALSRCLEKAATALVFPAPKPGSVTTLRHSWNFKPSH